MGSSQVLSGEPESLWPSPCKASLPPPCPRFQECYATVCFLLEIVGGGELKLLGQRRVFSPEGKEHKGSLLSPCGRALPVELQI